MLIYKHICIYVPCYNHEVGFQCKPVDSCCKFLWIFMYTTYCFMYKKLFITKNYICVNFIFTFFLGWDGGLHLLFYFYVYLLFLYKLVSLTSLTSLLIFRNSRIMNYFHMLQICFIISFYWQKWILICIFLNFLCLYYIMASKF